MAEVTSVQVSDGGLLGEKPIIDIEWAHRVKRARELAKGIRIEFDDIVGMTADEIEGTIVEKVEAIHGLG